MGIRLLPDPDAVKHLGLRGQRGISFGSSSAFSSQVYEWIHARLNFCFLVPDLVGEGDPPIPSGPLKFVLLWS